MKINMRIGKQPRRNWGQLLILVVLAVAVIALFTVEAYLLVQAAHRY